jgi:hypothetical protein
VHSPPYEALLFVEGWFTPETHVGGVLRTVLVTIAFRFLVIHSIEKVFWDCRLEGMQLQAFIKVVCGEQDALFGLCLQHCDLVTCSLGNAAGYLLW